MQPETHPGPDRRTDSTQPPEGAAVRLTRKYADIIDGVDLSHRRVGERLWLPTEDARLLLAERWAEPLSPAERRRSDRDDHDHQRCA